MSDIFISYSRKDSAVAHALSDALETLPNSRDPDIYIETWIDKEDLPYSTIWWDQIKNGIENATNFAVILSNNYLGSEVCNEELVYARSLGKPVIPVLINPISKEDKEDKVGYANVLKQRIEELNDWQRNPTSLADETFAYMGSINWIDFVVLGEEQTGDAIIVAMFQDIDFKEGLMKWTLRAIDSESRSQRTPLFGADLLDAEKWRDDALTKGHVIEPRIIDYISFSRRAQQRRQRITLSFSVLAVAVVGILALIAFSLYGSSEVNLSLANLRGTEARDQARTAVANANIAATNENRANQNADLAATSAVEALSNSNLAATNEAVALFNASIAETNEANAFAQATQAALERDRANIGATAVAIERDISESLRGAERANIALQTAPEDAIVLASNALRTAYSGEADEVLQLALDEAYTRTSWSVFPSSFRGIGISSQGVIAAYLDKQIFSSDPYRLALFDSVSGELFWDEEVDYRENSQLLFTRDGNTLITLRGGNIYATVEVWDMKTKSRLGSIDSIQTDTAVKTMLLSPDERWLYIKSIYPLIFDLNNLAMPPIEINRPMNFLNSNLTDDVTAAAWIQQNDSIYLLTAEGGQISAWDSETWQELPEPFATTKFSTIQLMATTPDGRELLVFDAYDTRAEVFGVRRGQRRLEINTTIVPQEVAFAPDNQSFIIRYQETAAHHNLETGSLVRTYRGIGYNGLVYAPDGSAFYSADTNILRQIPLENNFPPRHIAGGERAITSTSQVLINRFDHASLQTLDSTELGTFILGSENEIYSAPQVEAVGISQDGRWIAVAGAVQANDDILGRLRDEVFQHSLIELWDASTGQLAHVLLDVQGDRVYYNSGLNVEALEFSPDGTRLAAAYDDEAFNAHVILFDTSTGEQIWHHSEVDGNAWLSIIRFSPDHRYVMVKLSQMTNVYDTITGALQASWQLNDGSGLGFDSEGLVVIYNSSALHYYDVESLTQIKSVPYPNRVLAISQDARYAVTETAEFDRSAYLIDPDSGEILREMFDVSPNYVSFAPNSQHVVTDSASGEKLPRLWDIDYRVLVEEACQFVHEPFERYDDDYFAMCPQFGVSRENIMPFFERLQADGILQETTGSLVQNKPFVQISLEGASETVQWQRQGFDITDFVIGAEVTWTSSDPDDYCGFMFREIVDDDNNPEDYYLLQVDLKMDAFSVGFKQRGSFLPHLLTDAGGLLNPESENILLLVAVGSNFSLFINNEFAGSYVDDRLASGHVSTAGGTTFGDIGAGCIFRNIWLWDLNT